MILVAVFVLLAVLVARADAAPADDNDDAQVDDRDVTDWPIDERGARELAGRARLYIPITNAMIERIATFAPPVASVVAAAYRSAGLGEDPTNGWRHRSRWSALIPAISVRAGQHDAWRDISDPTVSHSMAFDVRASWRLERVMFDPNEPRIEMLDVARRRERRRVAALAIHLYFDWVTARAAADRDVRAVLDAQEKAAELDALTSGWFSQAIANQAELR